MSEYEQAILRVVGIIQTIGYFGVNLGTRERAMIGTYVDTSAAEVYGIAVHLDGRKVYQVSEKHPVDAAKHFVGLVGWRTILGTAVL